MGGMTGVLTIVGAGPGLGEEIAKRFGREGYSVGLLAKNPQVLEGLGKRLSGFGITVFAAEADVTDMSALQNALDEISKNLGTPDVVLANTSMFVEGTPSEVPLAIFETTWRVACLSTLIALQHVAPAMIKRGSGTFLVPGTPIAIKPWPPGAALGAAKAAVRNLTMGAHDELKPLGLHVTMLTIDGAIKAGGSFDPALIAEAFWQVSQAPESQWQPETVFSPTS